MRAPLSTDGQALALMTEHGQYALARVRATRRRALTECQREFCDRVERAIVKRRADRFGGSR